VIQVKNNSEIEIGQDGENSRKHLFEFDRVASEQDD